VSVEVFPPEADGSSDIRVRIRDDDNPSGRCVLSLDQDDGGRLRLDSREDQEAFIGALRDVISRAALKSPDIEFFLPLKLLSLDVDRWLDRVRRPLGTTFPVTIRSLDRLRNPEWQAEWPTFWERLRTHWNEPSWNAADANAGLWWRNEPSAIHEQTDLDVRLNLCTGVALTHVPNPKAAERENEFFHLLYRGVPLLIWPRELDAVAQLRRTVGDAIDAGPLCDLPSAIFDARRKATVNHPVWAHLSLLWDDPTQREPPQPYSSAPGQG